MNNTRAGLRYLLLCALVLAGTACISPASREQALPTFELLPPTSIDTDASAFLQLQLRADDGLRLLQLALDIQGQTLQLVVMDTLGRRLATFTYEDERYQLRREPGAPASIAYRQLLVVMQMIFWPLDALNRANGDLGWEFRQQNQRSAWYDGELYARINARETAPWSGRYDYHNLLDGSRISLQSVLLP